MGRRRAAELDALYQAHPNSLVFARAADIYLTAGRIQRAADACLHGIEQHPSYAAGYFVLAKCYIEQEQYGEARTALDRVTGLDPGHIGAIELLAGLCEKTGDTEGAVRFLRTLNTVDPLNPRVLDRIARLDDVTSGVSGACVIQTVEIGSPEPSRTATVGVVSDGVEAGGEAGGEARRWNGNRAPARQPAAQQDVNRLIQEIEMDSADAGGVQPSDQASSANALPGIATLTLAELYASQGVLDRSLDILKSLLLQRPGDKDIAARIGELEARQSANR